MRNSVRLSEKYGVNPSLEVCFFCNEPRGVALFGKLPDDKEAPRKVVVDYTPCDKCKENQAKGFTIVEASETPLEEGQPEIQKGLYPTGRWIVISEEAAIRIVGEDVASYGKCFMGPEAYNSILPK